MIYQNEYTLTVDIKKKGINQIPVFVKNDTAILNLRFLDDDMEYDISTADRYTVSFKKPSGGKVTGQGRYENGMLVYELGATEMEEVGTLEVIAQVYIGTTRISTRPFQVKILEDIENGIASQEQLTLLQELFIEVDNHGQYAKTQGDYAKAQGDNLGHKGNYSATVAYKDGNVVTYGGVNYICIKDTTAGIDPTNGTYWTSISPQASINEQSWTATEGQTLFTITNGKYVLGKGNIEVWVGGVPQIKGQGYNETSETAFTLTSGVVAGTIVYAKWFEGHMTITKGHMKSHELGGQDEIDITKLKNFQEQVVSPLAERAKQLQSLDNYRGGVVTIIDDDSYSTFLTRMKPVFDAQGVKLSIAVNTSWVGTSGKMTLTQLQQLKSEGYEILSHGYTHPNMDTMSLVDLENEWKLSKEYIVNNNLGNGEGFVYPTGLYSINDANKVLDVKTLTRKYYKYGIDNGAKETDINTLPVDSFEIKRRFFSPVTYNLNTIKANIDDAYQNKKWYILLTHCGIDDQWNDATSPSVWNEIIDYIQSLNMPILPFGEAEKLVGNAMSHGDSRTDNYHFVGKNGASWSHSNQQSEVIGNMKVSSMNAPITEYQKNKVTTMQISNTQDTFQSSGGVMSVYRGDTAFSYALFYPAYKNRVYKRYWSDSSNVWSGWVEVGGDAYPIGMIVSSMNAPISEYQQYKETIQQIANTSDTLLSSGGVLTTYRGGTHFSFQMYYPVKSNKVYKRYWDDTSSTWSEWVDINTPTSGVATSMDAAITTYTIKQWTDVQVSNTLDTLLNQGGLMRVYRGNAYFSFALFYPVNGNSVYKRRWIEGTSSWEAWQKISAI